MLKIQDGQARLHIPTTNLNGYMTPVIGVAYKGRQVFINTYQGVKIGRYVKAYILIGNNSYSSFGEIKLTVGNITHNLTFDCRYVLCEY